MNRMAVIAWAGTRIIGPVLIEDRDELACPNASLECHHVCGQTLS
jgi:hypothetical protein